MKKSLPRSIPTCTTKHIAPPQCGGRLQHGLARQQPDVAIAVEAAELASAHAAAGSKLQEISLRRKAAVDLAKVMCSSLLRRKWVLKSTSIKENDNVCRQKLWLCRINQAEVPALFLRKKKLMLPCLLVGHLHRLLPLH